MIRKVCFHRAVTILTLFTGALLAFGIPAHAAIVGSPHDFSESGPQTQSTDIAPSGTCSSCHIPHKAQDVRLWPRDLSDERNLGADGTGSNPNYILSPTLLCYDCHDDHANSSLDDDPSINSFKNTNRPQDIAFGMVGDRQGDGNWTADPPAGAVAGYYENTPPNPSSPGTNFGVYPDILTNNPTTRTGGHFFKTADPAPGNSSIDQYDKLPCRDCHDPHSWDNQAFIKRRLATGTAELSGVRASTFMSNPLSPGTRNDAESRNFCVTCHGTAPPGPTAVRFTDISLKYTSTATILSPPSGIQEHASTSSAACTQCHMHNAIGLSCTSCHGSVLTGQIWPNEVDDNPTRVLYADNQAGAHDNHVKTIGIHLGFGDYTTQGMYTTAEQLTICSFCHPNPGSGGHDTNAGGTQGGTSLSSRVDVYRDSDDTTTQTDLFRKFTGAQTHDVDATGVDGDQEYLYGAVDGTGQPIEGTCQNLVCHNQADTPFWNTPPDWSGAGSPTDPNCSTTSCHDPGTFTNCHVKHADPTNMGYDCKECHVDNGTNLGHQNGRVNMDFTTPGTIEGGTGGGDGYYDKSDVAANNDVHDTGDDEFAYKDGTNEKNCLAVFCHGGDSGLGGTSPMWTDATGSPPPEPSLCGSCHETDDIDSTPATWLSTGKHTTHLDDPASPAFGPKAFCDDCHQMTLINPLDPATRRNTDAAHVDGLVSFADGNGVNQGEISGDATVTSCDGCHGNDSGGGNIESRLAKFYWPDLDPRDGLTPQPSGTWFNSAETIDALLGNGDPRQAGGTNYCLNCHNSVPSTINTVAGTGGNPQTAPDKSSNFATSGHGLDTVSTYSPSGRTGAGAGCADCHDQTLAHISATIPSGDTDRLDTLGNALCTGCHDGTADGPGGKSAAQVSTHANTSTTMGYTAQESAMELNCIECHDVHGTPNIFMVNEVNTDGPLVATRLYGGVSDTSTYLFSGTVAFTANVTGSDYATAGAGDTTKICQTCHTATGHYQNDSDDGHFTTKCTGCHFHDYDANYVATSQDGFMPAGGCTGCHDTGGIGVTANTRATVPEFGLLSHHIPSAGLQESDCEVCHDLTNEEAMSPGNFGNVWLRFPDTDTGFIWDSATQAQRSQFCFECHDGNGATRLGASALTPFSGGATPPTIPADWSGASHNTAVSCFGGGDITSGCHSSHGSQNERLFAPYNGVSGSEEVFCYNCHDADGPATTDIQGLFVGTATHHDVDDTEQGTNGSAIECTNCHNPHTNSAVNKNADPDDTAALWTGTMNDFCRTCHDGVPPASVTFPASGNWSGYDKSAMEGPHLTDFSCKDCHDPHGSNFNATLKLNYRMAQGGAGGYATNYYDVCWQCHNETIIFDPAQSFEEHDRHTQTNGYGCYHCHDTHRPFDPGEDHYINFDNGVSRNWPTDGSNMAYNNGASNSYQLNVPSPGQASCFIVCHIDHNPQTYNMGSGTSAACNGCHTYPDQTGVVTNPNLHRLSSAHDRHVGVPSDEAPVGNRGFFCDKCHLNKNHNQTGVTDPTEWGTTFSDSTIEGNVDKNFDSWNPGASTTDAAGNYNETCIGLYCHGDTFPAASRGTTTQPTWGNTGAGGDGDCGDCHVENLTIASNKHDEHMAAAYGPGLNPDCTTGTGCHTAYDLDPAGTHVDNVRSFRTSPSVATAVPLATTQYCDGCHSTAVIVGGKSGSQHGKDEWGSATTHSVDCLTCHNGTLAGNSAADGTGSYAPDINTYWAAGGHGDPNIDDNVNTTLDSGAVDQVPPVRCETCHDVGLSHLPPPGGNPWRLLAATNFGAGGGIDSFCATQCHLTEVPADHTYNSAYPSLGPKEAVSPEVDTHPVSFDFTGVSTRWYQVPGEELPLSGDMTAWPTANADTHAFLCVTCHDPHAAGATDLTGVPPAQGTRALGGQNTESVDKQMTRFNYNGQPTPLCVKCHK